MKLDIKNIDSILHVLLWIISEDQTPFYIHCQRHRVDENREREYYDTEYLLICKQCCSIDFWLWVMRLVFIILWVCGGERITQAVGFLCVVNGTRYFHLITKVSINLRAKRRYRWWGFAFITSISPQLIKLCLPGQRPWIRATNSASALLHQTGVCTHTDQARPQALNGRHWPLVLMPAGLSGWAYPPLTTRPLTDMKGRGSPDQARGVRFVRAAVWGDETNPLKANTKMKRFRGH